jgi:hypothetical protein
VLEVKDHSQCGGRRNANADGDCCPGIFPGRDHN